jgi:hypothetical protein
MQGAMTWADAVVILSQELVPHDVAVEVALIDALGVLN